MEPTEKAIAAVATSPDDLGDGVRGHGAARVAAAVGDPVGGAQANDARLAVGGPQASPVAPVGSGSATPGAAGAPADDASPKAEGPKADGPKADEGDTDAGPRKSEPRRARKPARQKNNVRKIRLERMMSKAELARRANLSVLTVDRIEKGFGCRMDTKRKILEALGLSLDDRVRVFGEEE
jgi:DNA-binding XRE family transcriptional regulator